MIWLVIILVAYSIRLEVALSGLKRDVETPSSQYLNYAYGELRLEVKNMIKREIRKDEINDLKEKQ